jgi:hypothetical protein
MNVIPLSKEQKRAKSLLPSPYSFKGFRNRAAAGKPARLIDPVVNLTRDWLMSQQAKLHFLNRTKLSFHVSFARPNPFK